MPLSPIPDIPDGPQPEADQELEFLDAQTVPPVDALYIPRPVKVQQIASDRITVATYPLDGVNAIRIVGRAENGLASRVTISISQGFGHVGVGNGPEAFGSIFAMALVGSIFPNAYMMNAGAVGVGFAVPLVIETCDELWVKSITNGVTPTAWISVMIEQFYGGDGQPSF